MSADDDKRLDSSEGTPKKETQEKFETEENRTLEDLAKQYIDEQSEETKDIDPETQDEPQNNLEVEETPDTNVVEHVPKEVLLSRLESLIFSFPEPGSRQTGSARFLKGTILLACRRWSL